MAPKVCIIILNWNNWKDTIECLESLYQINYKNYNVIVVDNNSKDDSIHKIKMYASGDLEVKSNFFEYRSNNKPISVLKKSEIKKNNKKENQPSTKELILIDNKQNYGFSEGNNIGIKYALKNLSFDYILLLNNDTVVDPNFLSELVNSANMPNIGFLGPKVYYYDYEGRKDIINFAGGELNKIKGLTKHIGFNEIDNGQYEELKEVDYVQGCCILIKKQIFKEIGFFDPQYFTYWEETDLCRRGFNKGYKSIYVPKAKIWHKISSSNVGQTKYCFMVRNRFLFMKKNFGKQENFLFWLYFLFIDLWYNILIIIFYKRDFKLLKAFFKGMRHVYV